MFRPLLFQKIGLCLLSTVAGCQDMPKTSVASTPTPVTTPSPSPFARSIVLGDIFDEPAETIATAQPSIDFFAEQWSAHRIGYSFTGDEDTTIQWVVSGRVAAELL